MKMNDFVSTDMDPPKTPAAHIKIMAETGVTLKNKVNTALRHVCNDLELFSEARQMLTRITQKEDYEVQMIEEALTAKITEYPMAFALQLMVAGETRYYQLAQDPNNQYLVQNMVQQLHQAVKWVEDGMNVFNITHSLAAGLILTEPPPLTSDNFRLPFHSFAVVLPDGFVPFSWAPAWSEKLNDKSEAQQRWAQIVWVHRFMSPERGITYQITVECDGLSLFRRESLDNLEKADTLDKQLKSFDDDPALTDADNATMATAIRIIRNLVIWINSNGLPKAENTKRPKKKADPKDPFTPHTWFLGREVKLSPEIRKMATEVALGQNKKTSVEGWKVRMRFVVRGHWRNQPYGPGSLQRKEIWIQPYWKGPEGAAAWSHLYTT